MKKVKKKGHTMDINKTLEVKKRLIDEALKREVDAYFGRDDLRSHSKLYQAMAYTLFPGGKRLRPILTLLVNEVLDGCLEVINAACAIELFHTATLILDDLSSMDNSDYRRSKLSCHKVFGESTAILASIALISRGFEVLTNEFKASKIRSSVVLDPIIEAAQLLGTHGLIGGQFADLEADRASKSDPKSLDKERLDFIALHKTAPLFMLPASVGAHLADAKRREISAVREYAKQLGYAFQVSDDLLDWGEEKLLTFPKVYGLDASRRLLKEKIDEAILSIDFLGERADPLRQLAYLILKRAEK